MSSLLMLGIILCGIIGLGGVVGSMYGMIAAGSEYGDIFLLTLLVSCIFIGGSIYCINVYRKERAKEMEQTNVHKKKINLGKIFIFWFLLFIALISLIVGIINDIFLLSGFGLLFGMIVAIIGIRKVRIFTYSNMTDQELINEFHKCANDIYTALSVANGLTGLGSQMATDKVNADIQDYREKGTLIGRELELRGYKIDYSVLEGKVTKGKSKSKSDFAKMIKGAVVGGIIAGDVGAVIGANYEMNKDKEK